MHAQFAAVDGIQKIGTEALVLPAGEDQIQGDNLLTNPHDASLWTGAVNGSPSNYGNIGVKLTNNNPGVSAGYAYRAYTTDSSKWYLFRATISDPDNGTTRIFVGTSAGDASLAFYGYNLLENKSVIFQGTGNDVYLHIRNFTGVQDSSYWTNIELIEVEALGVDETTELVTNGFFTSNIDNWDDGSDSGGSIGWDALGRLELINTTGTAIARQSLTTVVGQIYRISFAKPIAAGTVAVNLGTTLGGSDIRAVSNTSVDTFVYYFEASGTTTYLQFTNSNTGTTSNVDNVTVTASGQLVTNHNLSDTTNEDFTLGADWSISGGELVGSNGGGITTAASESIDIAIGDLLIITYTIVSLTGTSFRWKLGGSNDNLTTARTAAGTYTETLTLATVSNTNIETSVISVTAVNIDNVTVRKGAQDISANADGVEIHGEVVKVPVNYNSDTVAFTNFSADNFVEQPYNSNMDWGTAGGHVRGWFKNSGNSAAEVIYSYGYYDGAAWGGGGWIRVYLLSTGYLYAYVSDDSGATYDEITSTAVYDDNEWHHFVFVVNGTTNIQLYVDGEKAATNVAMANALATLNNASSTIMIGGQQNPASFTNGQIAEIATGTTILSAQQVKTQYNKERVLFYPDSTYQVIDDTINYEVDLTDESTAGMEDINYSDSHNMGSQIATIKSQKNGHPLQTVPFNESQLKYAKRFLRSVPGQAFTISILGKQYAAIDPLTVYKTSSRETISRVGRTLREYSFTVRETR